jgi:hypothetical protein
LDLAIDGVLEQSVEAGGLVVDLGEVGQFGLAGDAELVGAVAGQAQPFGVVGDEFDCHGVVGLVFRVGSISPQLAWGRVEFSSGHS